MSAASRLILSYPIIGTIGERGGSGYQVVGNKIHGIHLNGASFLVNGVEKYKYSITDNSFDKNTIRMNSNTGIYVGGSAYNYFTDNLNAGNLKNQIYDSLNTFAEGYTLNQFILPKLC